MLKPHSIFIIVLAIAISSRVDSQKIMPDSGLFYYADDCHTTEIEFFPENTLCIINTTCDVAMFQAACGTYIWKGDTLLFENDYIKFLHTHLQIDTQSCNKGEVLIHLKTIAPFDQPEWRDVFMPSNLFSTRAEDSLNLRLIYWTDNNQKLSWSDVLLFDTLKLSRIGIVGLNILIPEASCINVEYPVLRRMAIDHPREYKQIVFSWISKRQAKITVVQNNHGYTRKFKYVLRDPFGQ